MEQQRLPFLGVVTHPHDFTHFARPRGIHTVLGDTAIVFDGIGGQDYVPPCYRVTDAPPSRMPPV